MEIKRRHVIYAVSNSWWILAFGAPLVAYLAYIQDEGLVGFLYGLSGIFIMTLGMFLYSLWRTQKKRAG